MQKHSVKGLYKGPGFWNLGGTLNELDSPGEVPEQDVVECENWKVDKDGRSRIKRPGYEILSGDFPEVNEPIIQIHEYEDPNGLARTVVVTPTKIIQSKESWDVSRKYHDTDAYDSLFHKLAYFQGNLVTIKGGPGATEFIVLKSSDGETWSDLVSCSGIVEGGSQKMIGQGLVEFNNHLFVTGNSNGGASPRVVEWDGSSWISHQTSAANEVGSGFLIWDGKLWASFLKYTAGDDEWEVRHYNGTSWNTITNYGGNSDISTGQDQADRRLASRLARFFVWQGSLYFICSVYVGGESKWSFQVWKFKKSTYDQFNKVYDSVTDGEYYALSAIVEYQDKVYIIGAEWGSDAAPRSNVIRLFSSSDMLTWTMEVSAATIGFPGSEIVFDGRIYVNCTFWTGAEAVNKLYYYDKILKEFALEKNMLDEAHNEPGSGSLGQINGLLVVGKYNELFLRTLVSVEWTTIVYNPYNDDPPDKVSFDGRLIVGGFGENLVLEGDATQILGIIAPETAPTVGTADGEAVTDEVIGAGDGAEKEFSATLEKGPPIQKSSITVTYTIGASDFDATDDGEGVITGTNCSGTIDYSRGKVSLTFTVAPDNATNIVIDYKYSNLVGDYKYAVTFMRSGNYPCESNPSPVSAVVSPYGQKGDLTDIPISSDSKVNRRRIYRTYANGAILYWLHDIEDNTTTVYADNWHDSSLGDEVSYDRLPPPKGSVFEVWDNRLWIAGNEEFPELLFFTNTGTAEEWSAMNFLNIKRRETSYINQIREFGDKLYVWKPDSWFEVAKVGSSYYDVVERPENFGTDAPWSVTVCNNILVWKSPHGIEAFNGSNCYRPRVSRLIERTMDSINDNHLHRCVGGYREKDSDFWLAIPTGSEEWPDRVVIWNTLSNVFAIYTFNKNITTFVPYRRLDNSIAYLLGTKDGFLMVHDSDYTTDNGEIINAHFKTGWINVRGERNIWNILRRLFVKYILPAEKAQVDVVIGVGTGSKTDFDYTAENIPVKKSSITIKYTIGASGYEATDDGLGAISGTDCTGTINYSTGVVALTFSTAPDNETNVTMSYTTIISITLKIYRNYKKDAFATIAMLGSTPTTEPEIRGEIMRRINLGVRGYHVMFEFINNQDPGGECRVLGWDWYFKKRMWKRTVKGD